MSEQEPTSPAATVVRQHAATILGHVDLTRLARPERYLQDPAVAEALHAAMVRTLSWSHIDLYLMTTGLGPRPIVARWSQVPVGCSRLEIAPHHDGPPTAVPAWLHVWVESGGEHRMRVITEQADDLRTVTTPHSGVVAAIAFRERLGYASVVYNLREHGRLTFTPRQVEYDYRAGIDDPDTPRLRRAYTSPHLANYTAPLNDRTQDWAVWMWLTNGTSGLPGPRWWRISELAVTAALPTITELGLHHIDLDHTDNSAHPSSPAPRHPWPEFLPFGRTEPPPYVPGLLW